MWCPIRTQWAIIWISVVLAFLVWPVHIMDHFSHIHSMAWENFGDTEEKAASASILAVGLLLVWTVECAKRKK
jgi:hypothetical protein